MKLMRLMFFVSLVFFSVVFIYLLFFFFSNLFRGAL